METELWASPPTGFEIKYATKDLAVVEYRVKKLKPIHWFLILWLVGWTAGCVLLLFGSMKSETGQAPPALMKVTFLGSDVLVASFLAYLLFSRRNFQVSTSELTIETECFSWKRNYSVKKDDIQQLRQVKTGGDGDDSFPSWGLKIEGTQKRSLLFREPYEVSYWLGQNLAVMLNVPFLPAEKP